MLAASQMGSTAFQKGLGAIHSLSHPVGAVLDTHHGLTNAVAMPYVLKFNRAAIDEKIQRLARWLGLRNPTFDGFMEWSLDLRRQIGIPHTLAELGVKESHLDKFAEMAAVDPTAGGNPVKAGVPEMRKMYDGGGPEPLASGTRPLTMRSAAVRCHSPPRPASSSSAAASWAARRPITWPSSAGRTWCCWSRGG